MNWRFLLQCWGALYALQDFFAKAGDTYDKIHSFPKCITFLHKVLPQHWDAPKMEANLEYSNFRKSTLSFIFSGLPTSKVPASLPFWNIVPLQGPLEHKSQSLIFYR